MLFAANWWQMSVNKLPMYLSDSWPTHGLA
jgi:hypothetical protein